MSCLKSTSLLWCLWSLGLQMLTCMGGITFSNPCIFHFITHCIIPGHFLQLGRIVLSLIHITKRAEAIQAWGQLQRGPSLLRPSQAAWFADKDWVTGYPGRTWVGRSRQGSDRTAVGTKCSLAWMFVLQHDPTLPGQGLRSCEQLFGWSEVQLVLTVWKHDFHHVTK